MTGRRATALGSMMLLLSGSAPGCAFLYDFGSEDGQGANAPTATASTTAATGNGTRLQGEACGAAAECTSGFCADGRCCDAACDGGCVACAATMTDGVDGTCAAVRAGTDPREACAQTACTTGVCREGRCEIFQDTTFCGEPTCAAGVKTLTPRCMAGACTPQGTETCDSGMCAPSNDVCSDDCMSADDCATNEFCSVDGECLPRLPDGAVCTHAEECQNKHCFSRGGRSVCCDADCGDACRSCLVDDTSVADGSCQPVRTGEDPKDACPLEADPCGTTGACGAGMCTLGALGVPCGNGPTCQNGMQQAPDQCNGFGMCVMGASQPCGLFVCDATTMQCKGACATSLDCVPGVAYCPQPGNVCQPLKEPGAFCGRPEECGTGICASDGMNTICCVGFCSGTCERCLPGGMSCGPAIDNTPCGGVGDVCCGGICGMGQVCGAG